MQTKIDILNRLARKERIKSRQYRREYPESARQCKHNVMLIEKQIKLLRTENSK